MFMNILIPLLIAFAGAIIYCVDWKKIPELKELGRCMFLAGMIATCFAFMGESASLGLGGRR